MVVRDMLVMMIDWYIGMNADFSVTVGMSGKYYKEYLPSDLYELFAKTYSDSNYNNFWLAIFSACEMFRTLAPSVAENLGFTYNQDEEKNMMEYLIKVKEQTTND